MIVVAVQIILFLVGLVFARSLASASRWQDEVRLAIFMFASFAAAILAPTLVELFP